MLCILKLITATKFAESQELKLTLLLFDLLQCFCGLVGQQVVQHVAQHKDVDLLQAFDFICTTCCPFAADIRLAADSS